MTIQASDMFYIDGIEYNLVDVENGRHLIHYGDFVIENKEDFYVCNTGCRKRYYAEYYLENNRLLGTMVSSHGTKTFKTPINYTGSCVVAGGKGIWFADVLSDYLFYEDAYELYFVEGQLIEKNSLRTAIEEYQEIKHSLMDERGTITLEGMRQVRKIARKHLKYSYEISSYKWGYKPEK